jgi:nitrogenase iron protein NifH
MRRIVVLGKGGIGKSTVTANLAVLARRDGKRILQMGCDPKHDSYLKHSAEGTVETVMARFMQLGRMDGAELDRLVVHGRTGVDLLEAGGPEPGKGCAGRAVSLTLDLLNDYAGFYDRYDLVFYDVLGDVVCGGFAAPLRDAYDSDVVVVVSGEYMSLYAANNIARGVRNLAGLGGARLVGIVANRVHDAREEAVVSTFAARLGTCLLGVIPFDRRVALADAKGSTLCEAAGRDQAAQALREAYLGVYRALEALPPEARVVPNPMPDAELQSLVFAGLVGEGPVPGGE